MRPARELVSNLLEGGEERLGLTGGRACVTPRDRDDLAADRGSIDDVDLRERAGFELVGDRGLGKERDSEALLDHLLRRVDVVELHALNASMFELAKGYSAEGMSAYVRLQEHEFELEEKGYTATRHQREVGAGYFDLVAQAVSGGESSTLALRGSTEEAQFGKA